MATTTAPPEAPRSSVIPEFDFPLPRFVKALPGWVRVGAIVLLLCAGRS